MYICYVCNGLEPLNSHCPECQSQLVDGGKIVDYYDDYSPYLEQEDAQQIDGIPDSGEKQECVHIAFCKECNQEKEIIIAEQMY